VVIWDKARGLGRLRVNYRLLDSSAEYLFVTQLG